VVVSEFYCGPHPAGRLLPTSRSCTADATLASMTMEDLRARNARLDQLSLGLAREAQLFSVASKINDPLLYLERNAYRHAVQDARAGVEKARVTLAKALARLESAGR